VALLGDGQQPRGDLPREDPPTPTPPRLEAPEVCLVPSGVGVTRCEAQGHLQGAGVDTGGTLCCRTLSCLGTPAGYPGEAPVEGPLPRAPGLAREGKPQKCRAP